MNATCSIEEAKEAKTLEIYNRKTQYFDYKLLVRSKDEIRLNIKQNISKHPTGGEYINPLFYEKYNVNNYEPLDLEFLNREDVWLDLGGHIGLFAVRMLTQFPKIDKVISYEPFINNVQFAKMNLKLNGVYDKCIIHNKAVSDLDNKKVNLYLSTDSGKHTLQSVKGRDVIEVDAININEVLDGVTAIKMDIEGLEYNLIKAIKDWSNIRICMIEYHFHYRELSKNREEKFQEVLDIMYTNFDRVYVNPKAKSGKHWITHFVAIKED